MLQLQRVEVFRVEDLAIKFCGEVVFVPRVIIVFFQFIVNSGECISKRHYCSTFLFWTSEKYQRHSHEIFSLESLLKCRISLNFLGNFCWLFHIMQLKFTFPLCAVLATWLSRAFLFSFGWEIYIYIYILEQNLVIKLVVIL